MGALVNIGSKYASILEVFNINQRDSTDNNKIDKFQGKGVVFLYDCTNGLFFSTLDFISLEGVWVHQHTEP